MSSSRGLEIAVSREGTRASVRGLSQWLVRVAPPQARGVVSVAIVSDRCVRELNRKYRGRDYATDVLSFSAFVAPKFAKQMSGERRRATARQAGASNPQSPLTNRFLGDIVIARGVARKQAAEAGHSEQTELRILALHGLLHLLGYDHERDHGRMASTERRLRRKGRLDEGLIERGSEAGRR